MVLTSILPYITDRCFQYQSGRVIRLSIISLNVATPTCHSVFVIWVISKLMKKAFHVHTWTSWYLICTRASLLKKRKKEWKRNVIGNVTEMTYDLNEKYILQNNLRSFYEMASWWKKRTSWFVLSLAIIWIKYLNDGYFTL